MKASMAPNTLESYGFGDDHFAHTHTGTRRGPSDARDFCVSPFGNTRGPGAPLRAPIRPVHDADDTWTRRDRVQTTYECGRPFLKVLDDTWDCFPRPDLKTPCSSPEAHHAATRRCRKFQKSVQQRTTTTRDFEVESCGELTPSVGP